MKAKAVLRELGHAEDGSRREYADWHIEIRGGVGHVSVWYSSQMVFLAMADVPVYYQPGPWEQYLDRLFHRGPASEQLSDPDSAPS